MSTIVSGSSSKQASGRGAAVYSKSYYTIVEFAKFLRDNGNISFTLSLQSQRFWVIERRQAV